MNSKKTFIEILSLLFILLFAYTAFSKMLEFENFKVQVGLSPLLTAFQNRLPQIVITVELVVAVLLLVPRYRVIGLLCAYFLMTSFTAYVAAILEFSPYLPCSCGGILETMNWTEHLVFNGTFTALALIAFSLEVSGDGLGSKKPKTSVA